MAKESKHHIAGGNSREVYLVEYEGEKLVLKVTKHQSEHQSTRHVMEAIALDVVSEREGVRHTNRLQPGGWHDSTAGFCFDGVSAASICCPVCLCCFLGIREDVTCASGESE